MSLTSLFISVMSLTVVETYHFHDNEWPMVKGFTSVQHNESIHFSYDIDLLEHSDDLDGLNGAIIVFSDGQCNKVNPDYIKSQSIIGKLHSYEFRGLKVGSPGGTPFETIEVPTKNDGCVMYIGSSIIEQFTNEMLPASGVPYELY
ncbi:hypothetical protein C9J03_04050 [Photobacterium gaetbulicola]|uniref:Uncharacterized protein n=2 Tax=Photobacterium gaetbulicola TaxID=1295392 RepID=A0A0C5WKK9_9GAMM|nr:hypothetical protein H744_1c1754 [Photobacterium gaetbulicola Gung47]PSU14086.1 hypothetical protein C9J03_04050 [Photobacterium gaetbulicola]